MEQPAPIRLTLDWGPRFSLSVFNLGLACCAIEFVAASLRHAGMVRREPVADPIEVIVVSGTVTAKLAPGIRSLYDALPSPYVLSFGACASSGGPYWDSYSVTKGVGELVPVDVFVPGCPPRPEALLDGLRQLQAKAAPR